MCYCPDDALDRHRTSGAKRFGYRAGVDDPVELLEDFFWIFTSDDVLEWMGLLLGQAAMTNGPFLFEFLQVTKEVSQKNLLEVLFCFVLVLLLACSRN